MKATFPGAFFVVLETEGGGMKNPCSRSCPKRTAECHSTCGKYAVFWEKCEQERRRRARLAAVRGMGDGLRKALVKKAARIRQGREK